MSDLLYYISCGLLALGILLGLSLLSKVKTAAAGNLVSCLSCALAVILTLVRYEILSDKLLYLCMGIGLVIGMALALRVKMIAMPQMVAFLHGLGVAASALVAILVLTSPSLTAFTRFTGGLALAVGSLTFTSSMVAAGKLQRLLPQKPVILASHKALLNVCAVLILLPLLLLTLGIAVKASMLVNLIASLGFGLLFTIRVGGADMPITISLLNCFAGVAGAIAGMSIDDPLLIAAEGIVGSSGLLLTQIMCRAMNRSLLNILFSKGAAAKGSANNAPPAAEPASASQAPAAAPAADLPAILRSARDVIIVPGYGMALAQAQSAVKTLADRFAELGAKVRYAIHPVAGRMPGHMNVLLCEVDVPYEQLYELDDINPDFATCDLVLVIGANDTINPAANTAEGTPIYGMPVLAVAEAKWTVVCNLDTGPGYAGVPNAIYNSPKTILRLGDAKESLAQLLQMLS